MKFCDGMAVAAAEAEEELLAAQLRHAVVPSFFSFFISQVLALRWVWFVCVFSVRGRVEVKGAFAVPVPEAHVRGAHLEAVVRPRHFRRRRGVVDAGRGRGVLVVAHAMGQARGGVRLAARDELLEAQGPHHRAPDLRVLFAEERVRDLS